MGLLVPHGRRGQCHRPPDLTETDCAPSGAHSRMTNRIALWLAAIILLAILVDASAFDWRGILFLAGKFLELVQYVAFWR